MEKKKNYLKLVANLCLTIFVVGLVIYVMRHSMGDIFEGLKATSPKIVLLVLLLGLTYQVAEGINIARIAAPFQAKFHWLDGFFCSAYVAFYRVITFGSGTSISEVLFYRKQDIETSEGIGIAALHMIFYKIGLIIFSLLGLLYCLPTFLSRQPWLIVFILAGIIVSSGIVAVILVVSSNEKLHHWLIKILSRWLKSEKWQERLESASGQIDALQIAVQRTMKTPRVFIQLVGLNLFKLIFWLCIPYVILSQKHEISFFLTFSLTAFSVILAGVIPTPAGIGSFEFVYLLLFRDYIGTVDAGSSVLLYRFASYVLPFLIGMLYVFFTRNQKVKAELQEYREEKKLEKGTTKK